MARRGAVAPTIDGTYCCEVTERRVPSTRKFFRGTLPITTTPASAEGYDYPTLSNYFFFYVMWDLT